MNKKQILGNVLIDQIKASQDRSAMTAAEMLRDLIDRADAMEQEVLEDGIENMEGETLNAIREQFVIGDESNYGKLIGIEITGSKSLTASFMNGDVKEEVDLIFDGWENWVEK